MYRIHPLTNYPLVAGTRSGQAYANQLRRRRPRPGDKWHLDEVFLTINKERHYLWRTVDQDGNVLDILVQSRRNKQAAKKFFRKLLKGLTYVPRVIITDKLKRVVFQKWRWPCLYRPFKGIAVDEQANDDIVHLGRFREANGLADQAFNARP